MTLRIVTDTDGKILSLNDFHKVDHVEVRFVVTLSSLREITASEVTGLLQTKFKVTDIETEKIHIIAMK